MGRDTPDLTALEVAILAEAPLSDMAVAMSAPTPLTALTPPAWLPDWVACIARRWAVPAETAAAWLVAEGAAHLTASEIVGTDGWRSGADRMVLPRPGGPDDAQPMWVDISDPLQHIALVDLGALAASGPAEQATICGAVGAANWGRDTGFACGDHHQPGAENTRTGTPRSHGEPHAASGKETLGPHNQAGIVAGAHPSDTVTLNQPETLPAPHIRAVTDHTPTPAPRPPRGK